MNMILPISGRSRWRCFGGDARGASRHGAAISDMWDEGRQRAMSYKTPSHRSLWHNPNTNHGRSQPCRREPPASDAAHRRPCALQTCNRKRRRGVVQQERSHLYMHVGWPLLAFLGLGPNMLQEERVAATTSVVAADWLYNPLSAKWR